MNWFTSVLYSALTGMLLACSLFGQSGPVITVEKVMTVEELKATGVSTLTREQRAALDQWLSEYTVKLIQLAQRAETRAPIGPGTTATSYTGSSGGHWIKSKVSNGSMIILEDGSMWEINSVDRIDTSL